MSALLTSLLASRTGYSLILLVASTVMGYFGLDVNITDGFSATDVGQLFGALGIWVFNSFRQWVPEELLEKVAMGKAKVTK